MPEPITLLLGAVAVLLLLVLLDLNRHSRLLQHINETARSIATREAERNHLLSNLDRQRLAHPPEDSYSPAPSADDLRERLAEAEKRLSAVNRLYAAQVRTWNLLGMRLPGRLLRGFTKWSPLDEPPVPHDHGSRQGNPT